MSKIVDDYLLSSIFIEIFLKLWLLRYGGVIKCIPLTLFCLVLFSSLRRNFWHSSTPDFLHFLSFENFFTNHILSLLTKVKDKQVVSVFHYMQGFLTPPLLSLLANTACSGVKRRESINEKRGKEQEFPSLTITDAICYCNFFSVFSRSRFLSVPDFSDKILTALKG